MQSNLESLSPKIFRKLKAEVLGLDISDTWIERIKKCDSFDELDRATTGLFLYVYCKRIGKRLPEAEPFIMQSPFWAYLYALYVLKGRWPEAEPVIMQDAERAYFYAQDVLKGRWPEAEHVIMRNPLWRKSYLKFLKKLPQTV